MWRLGFLLALLTSSGLSLPSRPSFVVSTTPSSAKETKGSNEERPKDLKIYQMHVISNVTNRFCHTSVNSKVKNFAPEAKEATFSVVLPNSAYISGFVLEIDGKKYEAYVKEKEEAKSIYEEAVDSGLSAAHVAASTRDSNRFDVSVNVESQKKAAFYLTYEELLQRENEQYEIVININPGQVVKDLQVEVNIEESRPLRFVKAPSIRSGNEISKQEKEDLDPKATITYINNATTKVLFKPSYERQKELAHNLGADENHGLSGQFVVQYDVARDPNGGEVLLQDGYFVHFFSPSDIPPLPKQVVFVLDTSGSMYGGKIQQLKQAMHSILNELKENDIFNLVEFDSVVKTWNIKKHSSVMFPQKYDDWKETKEKVEDVALPPAFPVNEENVKKAKEVVDNFSSTGGTNIYSALKIAFRLVELAAHSNKAQVRQPLIIFLTDGDPTEDVTDINRIIRDISELNSGKRKAAIFSLSFGDGADKKFLQELSLNNRGFSRHIYEAADASIQLTDFYTQISSPLLTDVKFKYTPSASNLTRTSFPIFFGGSELVVCGRIDEGFVVPPEVEAFGLEGSVALRPQVLEPVTHLERLWAYLTVKQLLDDRELFKNKTALETEALALALKYSFVTPLSSLVVVKPDNTGVVGIVPADTRNVRNCFMLFFEPLSESFLFLALVHNFHSGVVSGKWLIRGAGASAATNIAVVPFQTIVQSAPFDMEDFAIHSSTRTPERENKLQELQKHLSWLTNDIVALSKHCSVKQPLCFKRDYNLGLNETISEEPECQETPLNEKGTCKLLQDCPEVYNHLTDLSVFEKYFCIVEGYAGVCCPRNS